MKAPAGTDKPAIEGTSDNGAARRLDRRALFFAGGASAAALVAVAAGDAAAAPIETGPELPQVVGHITSHVSSSSVNLEDDVGNAVRLDLAAGATVERNGSPAALADFGDGDWLLAVGVAGPDDKFTATRVIPAVLGAKPPARN